MIASSAAAARPVIEAATEHGAPPPRVRRDSPTRCGRAGAEMVVVATPSGAHLEVAEAAIEAGLHVLIEKPVEITSPRAIG
ncbi:Gfo/Idh/MocA family oxidoreductase [Dactylosporangium sp. CA-233914]|uniref:Gfo/Idh/MocA family oxidoreductase n=1 Tax=Dactylosporangium sp. CA-233914 TaxID=3239934 RepID=UPI003D8EACFD